MKSLTGLVLLLVITVAHAEPEKQVVFDRVLAEVNSSVILQSDLTPRMVPYMEQMSKIRDKREYQRKLKRLGRQVLKELVNEELILQAAKSAPDQIQPMTEEQIQLELDRTKKKFNLDDAGLRQALAAQGHTMSSYRKVLQRQFLRLQAVNFFVRQKISVNEQDVTARYQEMQRRTGGVDKIHLFQIVVALEPNADEAAIKEAKTKAEAIVKEVRAGANFQDTARAKSDDEQSKRGGGDMGWIEKGVMPQSWERVAFGLADGEVAEPLLGPDGFRIFYVKQRATAKLPEIDKLRDKIKSDIYRERLEKAVDTWVKKLRTKAHISIKV